MNRKVPTCEVRSVFGMLLSWPRLLPAIVLAVLVLGSGGSDAQAPSLDPLYDSVVSIHAERTGTQPADWNPDWSWDSENGSGIIVAEDGQTIRLLTAHHVVAGPSAVTTITLSFPGLRGVTTRAKVLVVSDALDLALLETKLPAGVHLHKDPVVLPYPADHPVKRTMPVWTVDDELDSVPNTVTRLDVDTDTRKFLYTGNSIGKGYSGGPVFDDHARLVGMHLASKAMGDGSYKLSVALKIDAALDFLDSAGFEASSFNKLVSAAASTGLNLSGDPIERLRAMGLKYDVESFSQAVADGTLPAIKAYLDAGMSANTVYEGNYFVINLAAAHNSEAFPAILREFLLHKLDFTFHNRGANSTAGLGMQGDSWFFVDGPETVQDQLFFTLSNSTGPGLAIASGKALLTAGASPLHAMHTAQNCPSRNAHYCSQTVKFIEAIGYKATPEPVVGTNGARVDGKKLYEDKQFAQALPLLEASAAAGDAPAAALVGTYYAYGLGGVAVDEQTAMQWLVKAAHLGDRDSMRGSGYGYLVGSGVTKDYAQALGWFRKAATLGDGPSMTAIGYQYFIGLGLPQDDEQAADWFRKATAAGDTEPAARLQNVLDSTAPKRRASYTPRPWDAPENQAWALFRKAVLKNSGQDFWELGGKFESGDGGAPKDASRAARYYLRGADLGDTQAMYALAALYDRGEGVPRDPGKSLAWLQKSASAGDASAQSLLGAFYARGEHGVRRDDRQAVFWFRKAAEGGFAQGMTNLAVMYSSGLGVGKDMGQAVYWYRKAAALGEPVAIESLKGISR